MLALGRSLPHDSLAEAADAAPSVLRAALREAREAHIIVADELRRTPLPPRAAGRGRLRRPASRRARGAARPPRRGARAAPRRATAATRSLAAEIAHHYLQAGDQPAAFAAALRAADAAERVHAYGEAAVQFERALTCGRGCRTPPARRKRPRRAARARRQGAGQRRRLRASGDRARARRRGARRRLPSPTASPNCCAGSLGHEACSAGAPTRGRRSRRPRRCCPTTTRASSAHGSWPGTPRPDARGSLRRAAR